MRNGRPHVLAVVLLARLGAHLVVDLVLLAAALDAMARVFLEGGERRGREIACTAHLGKRRGLLQARIGGSLGFRALCLLFARKALRLVRCCQLLRSLGLCLLPPERAARPLALLRCLCGCSGGRLVRLPRLFLLHARARLGHARVLCRAHGLADGGLGIDALAIRRLDIARRSLIVHAHGGRLKHARLFLLHVVGIPLREQPHRRLARVLFVDVLGSFIGGVDGGRGSLPPRPPQCC